MRFRNARTVARLLPWVLGAIAIAVGGLYLVRRLVPVAILRESNDVAGNYLQTLGTIYAVLLAFVTVVVWQQFNDARSQVEREANELLDLCRIAKGFPERVGCAIHDHLRAYVDGVLREEWEEMAKEEEEQAAERVSDILDQIADVLHGYQPGGDAENALYAEALARLNDLSDTRTNRLSSSRTKIPLTLNILLYAGAAITVASMYLFAVESFLLHALMTGAMAGAISHVLYLIGDLDDCFSGDYQVPRAPFQRVQRYLEGCGGGRG